MNLTIKYREVNFNRKKRVFEFCNKNYQGTLEGFKPKSYISHLHLLIEDMSIVHALDMKILRYFNHMFSSAGWIEIEGRIFNNYVNNCTLNKRYKNKLFRYCYPIWQDVTNE